MENEEIVAEEVTQSETVDTTEEVVETPVVESAE